METLFELLQDNPWFSVFTAAVFFASSLAAVLPTPKKGSVLAKIYSVVDLLAINIGKAKDKGDGKS